VADLVAVLALEAGAVTVAGVATDAVVLFARSMLPPIVKNDATLRPARSTLVARAGRRRRDPPRGESPRGAPAEGVVDVAEAARRSCSRRIRSAWSIDLLCSVIGFTSALGSARRRVLPVVGLPLGGRTAARRGSGRRRVAGNGRGLDDGLGR
jgi:hypothetical protein